MSLRPTCCRLMPRRAGQGPSVRSCKGAVRANGREVCGLDGTDGLQFHPLRFHSAPPTPWEIKPASWKRLHRKGSPTEYLLALKVLRGFVWFGYSVAANTCHVPGMGYNLECHSQKLCMFPWCRTNLLPPYPQPSWATKAPVHSGLAPAIKCSLMV